MSETITIHPPHAWILGIVPDDNPGSRRQPADAEPGDRTVAPVDGERRDGADQSGDAR